MLQKWTEESMKNWTEELTKKPTEESMEESMKESKEESMENEKLTKLGAYIQEIKLEAINHNKAYILESTLPEKKAIARAIELMSRKMCLEDDGKLWRITGNGVKVEFDHDSESVVFVIFSYFPPLRHVVKRL